MRLCEMREIEWDPWDYSVYLNRKGYKWPIAETRITYINVTGQSRYKPHKARYGLVTYQPKRAEYHFKSPEDAEKYKDRIQPKMWQILDMVTGRVISDPNQPQKIQEE